VKIGIVVPCFNNLDGLAQMLESVRTTHTWTPYIIDNWRENRGCSKAWNLGFDRAKADGCDFILICNDDILFAKHTIDALVEEFEASPKDVVMMTAVNSAGACPTPETIFEFPRQESNHSEHPDFSCIMIKPDFQDKIGRFDVNFWPASFEDNDTHRRINVLGYKAICTSGAAYYHFGSVTKVKAGPVSVITENFDKNQMYYKTKWGGMPGAESHTVPFGDQTKTAKDW